jgi:hypothetical protein
MGLWVAHSRSALRQFNDSGKGHLMFPHYRGKLEEPLRISEQEARFAFVESLCRGSLSYSVEAPTIKRYQFTGLTPISAQTDVALYDVAGQTICNVEFKAKGVSPSAGSHFSIFKDMQKLLREPLWGLWFHLLESTNNSTINKLLSVMANEIDNVQKFTDIDSPGLTIHICVLKHGFSVHKDLMRLPGVFDRDSLHDQLRVNMSVSSTDLQAVNDLNGWELHKR